jgi:DNA (cytosine-5)-methyltransferase 1
LGENKRKNMTHGSLFSGIGGFDLAAEWMGWENKFHCEWNEFGQKILKHYWPNAESYGDITKTDFTLWRGRIDILTGGFPCQPYSTAGKRLGKEDERHLWPEMLRAIREIQPRWIVGENVRGLTNWNGGVVFDEVQADLEAQGYEVLPFLLPACGVNAPHRRDRIWFIANAGLQRQEIGQEQSMGIEQLRKERDAANTLRSRQSGPWRTLNSSHSETFGDWEINRAFDVGRWPTQPPVCNRNDGVPANLDGFTVSKWKQESIKAGGNAVVPQVVYQIFKAIEQNNGENTF